jgi:hypothetical protein
VIRVYADSLEEALNEGTSLLRRQSFQPLEPRRGRTPAYQGGGLRHDEEGGGFFGEGLF